MADALEGVVRAFVHEHVIARLEVEGRKEPVKIIGELGGVAPGESVRVEGDWENHPRWGRQFRVQRLVPLVPATAEGAARYLGSGLVRGIGPEMARRIVARLGASALEILDAHPERLAEVPGIGPKRAAALKEALQGQKAIRQVLVFLHGQGISAALAARIHRRYGLEAIARLRENPYRLAREVAGIGFQTADRIAQSLGFEKDAPERVEAGLLHALWEASEEGHLYVEAGELVRSTAPALGVEVLAAQGALARLGAARQIAAEGEEIALPDLFAAEVELAARLRAQVAAGRRGPAPRPAPSNSPNSDDLVRLSDAQRRALAISAERAVMVLTGGPGTGKTTVIRAIVRAHEAAGSRVALAAPTGRAAKWLAEATGRPASTVHRLLEADGRGRFLRGPGAELGADLVVVDEASMLDVLLARALLAALRPGTALVLSGDVDQLPSVGPGQVLRDVIDSGAVPVVRLSEIFRQAQRSRIVLGAHAVNAGRIPEPAPEGDPDADYFFIRAEEPARAQSIVTRLCQERIPARFGLHPVRDIQVLSPMRRGEAGTVELGRALQAALNPSGAPLTAGGRVFRVGDKVLQTRNDYDRDVWNGDVGLVRALEPEEGALVVDFDGRAVRCEGEQIGELELAYALTVHRSQGSEYPAVVMPLVTQHFVMLQRNLVYTAMTRARRLCVLVGSPRAFALAVRNADTRRRRTLLAKRLAAHP